MLALRLLAALTAVLAWGALALWWVGRASRGTTPLTGVPAALCVVFWVWAAGFQLLALSHAFALWLVVPTWVVLPAVAAWTLRRPIQRELERVGERLRAERRDLAAELRRHPVVGLALSAVAAHLAVRAARAMVTPTFGWDDFTYHLYRAARWVQTGGIVLEPAPDAWTYYEFFPWGGDLLWAWTLVWGLGDALVPWVAMGVWAACLVTAYALARQLGQKPLVSLLVASALALMPSQISQIQTAYVDNAVLFLALAATLFLVERHRIGAQSAALLGSRPDATWSSLLLGMSCGLGVLVKTSFLPMAAMAAMLTVGFAAANRRLAPLAAFGAGASVAVPNLAFNWIQRGSPFYPFRIAGFLPFNHQFSETLAKFGPADPWRQGLRALGGLIVEPPGAGPFLNLGWSAVILLGVGLVGARRISSMPGGAVYLFWCFAGCAITALQLFSPANGSMLTLWGGTLGRLVVPSLAAWMVLTALVDERPVRALLVAAVVVEYFLRAPWMWPHEVLIPTAILGGWATLCALTLGLGTRGSEARLRFTWLAASLVFTVALARGLHTAHRYDAYRLFAEGSLDGFDRAAPVEAWPVWRRLDADSPMTIAATAGWDNLAGHNWFRYPLLGSRLQNRVIYLPISEDGSILSYADRDALREVADRQAWLARLARAEVDWVLVMSPPSIEGEWIRELPNVFAIDSSLTLGDGILARLDRRNLAEQLAKVD